MNKSTLVLFLSIICGQTFAADDGYVVLKHEITLVDDASAVLKSDLDTCGVIAKNFRGKLKLKKGAKLIYLDPQPKYKTGQIFKHSKSENLFDVFCLDSKDIEGIQRNTEQSLEFHIKKQKTIELD